MNKMTIRLGDLTYRCLEELQETPQFEGCSFNVIIGNLIRMKLMEIDPETYNSIPGKLKVE